MNTQRWTARLLACAAVAASCVAYAQPVFRDGADPFADHKSTRSRAEVRTELEQARAQGWRPLRDGESWSTSSMSSGSSGSTGEIGAFGSPGARYSGRTREDVRAELMERPHRYPVDGLD